MNSLERRSLPWLIQVGPKCNHTYPSARETEGVWILTYGREGLGKMEAGIAVLSLSQAAARSWKRQGRIFP